GVNTEYASKMPHDYANSRFSDDYQIWGIDLGYAPEHQSWKTWDISSGKLEPLAIFVKHS
ncbi:hypothetical protein, partial [Acinetobacter sp. YH18001]|uniref:hypothetical protein n=1 Tax=Acinetobacter sp. YH18001 TaxID=2601197 RepID=UPI0015D27820